ncbi:MAG TPA: GNAT family N-acetyltransferase [Gaiellaceae bacterium]|nr:GNAT family N-acetyltransferase [Gaiellaceae bacterium]
MSSGRPREALSDGVVTLRPWTEDDAAAIVECVDGDPEIARWLDQIPQPYGLEDALAFIRGLGEQSFAVTDLANGRVLGSIGVRWSDPGDVGEVGYWLRADARGRGMASRALVLVSRWALSHEGVVRLQLRAAEENRASRRVAEKAGFRLEGVLRAAHWSPRLERRLDWAMYSLLPGELR